MYNNRHWVIDEATGAGIGIHSTKITYWINPWLNEKLFNKSQSNVNIIPYYNGLDLGFEFVVTF